MFLELFMVSLSLFPFNLPKIHCCEFISDLEGSVIVNYLY